MRIRTIKPAFYKDDKLADLDPLVRILFSGLWGLADSEGRLECRPRYIKAEVLPYDECDIPSMLVQLHKHRFIEIYSVGRKHYIAVTKFKKHQRITGTEAMMKSDLPPPPTGEEKRKQSGNILETIGKQFGNTEETFWKQSGNNLETTRKQKVHVGRERKGKEGKGDKDSPVAKIATEVVTAKSISPQAEFLERFQTLYESMTNEKFKVDKHHFVIVANLIKDHGFEAVVAKAKTLALLCRARSVWFTKGGWSDYTIEKLSSQWNSILPNAVHNPSDQKDSELLAELKKQEALRAIAEH